MKRKIILILGIVMSMAFLFSSCSKTNINNDEVKNTRTNDFQTANRPSWSWRFGVSCTLWKPRNNCLEGWGICKINALFFEVDWTVNRKCSANVGIDPNNGLTKIIFTSNTSDIGSILAQNNNSFTIENGDEDLYIEQSVLSELGVNSISFVQGTYPCVLNQDGNYEVTINSIIQ